MSKRVTVTHLRDLTFDAEMDGHHLMIGDDRGPSATALVVAGLAACTGIDVVSILRKSRQPFTDVLVHAETERAGDHPRRFTDILLTYEVRGEGVDRRAVERAVDLSEEKYCSVSASLKEPVTIRTRVELPDVTDEGGGAP